MARVKIQIPRVWVNWFQQVFQGVQLAEDLETLTAFDRERAQKSEDPTFEGAPRHHEDEPDFSSARSFAGQIEELRREVAAIRSIRPTADQEARERVAFASSPDRSLEGKVAEIEALISFSSTSRNQGFTVVEDTHANRGNYPVKGLYRETDRLYWFAAHAGVWEYLDGLMVDVIANIPADLGLNDVGARFGASNFDRIYRWTGAAWEDDKGQPTRGMIGVFAVAPGTGWQVCDGSTVSGSTATGGTANVTVPDYSTAAYLKVISAGATIGPSAAGGTVANEAAHTHDTDPGAVASGVPSATTTVQSGSGASVASDSHTHQVDVAATTSGAGTAHNHGPGTLQLRNTELLAYYRL